MEVKRQMKINKMLSEGKPYNAWECDCGTITPIKKGLEPEPECEYCRRRREETRVVGNEKTI